MKKNTKKETVNTLNMGKLSNDNIVELFTTAFDKQVGRYHTISEYEINCVRKGFDEKDIRLELTIIGMAGAPTLDDFKSNTVENSSPITISIEDKGEAVFELIPEATVMLNSNDYIIAYQLV